MNTQNRLKDQVIAIINDIENGVVVTQQDIDDGYYDEGQYEAGDIIGGFDYIKDLLDINYTLDSERQYKGARILVAFGGPNIWINTVSWEVEAYWWGDSCVMSYNTDAMDLDGTCDELFNC